MMSDSPGNPPSLISPDDAVTRGAAAATTPAKSMRDMLGIRDPSAGKNGEEVQKQREKTAYVKAVGLGEVESADRMTVTS